MLNIFKIKNIRKAKELTPFQLYEKFLMNIDGLSATRLRRIDMAFAIIKREFFEKGFNLNETMCVGPNIKIKRNQFGFYVDETNSLNSKDDYLSYNYGLNFFEKNKERFNDAHQLLCEKECIMRGFFNAKGKNKEELINMAHSIGYGSKRDLDIYEEEPIHPTSKYLRIVELLKLAETKNKKEYDNIIEECLDEIRVCLKKNIKLEIKKIDDKYDTDFDESYGVLIIDQNIGDMHMLYEFDGFEIKKDTIEKYLQTPCVYLEIYLRIIMKCLKKELEDKYLQKSNDNAIKK